MAGKAGVPKEIRDRLQNHPLQDVSSKHYDRWNYMAGKRAGMAKVGQIRPCHACKKRMRIAALAFDPSEGYGPFGGHTPYVLQLADFPVVCDKYPCRFKRFSSLKSKLEILPVSRRVKCAPGVRL